MDKEYLNLQRHLKGALAAMNKINALTNEKKSCNNVTCCSKCNCNNDDRLAEDGHPGTKKSSEVAVFDTRNEQRRKKSS